MDGEDPFQYCNDLRTFNREEIVGNLAEYKEKAPIVEIEIEEFNPVTAKYFELRMAQASKTGAPLVIIRIDSPGGCVYSLSRMLLAVECAKNNGMIVVTICTGKAMSCGSILLAMGSLGFRYCNPHGTILLHEISGGVQGKLIDMKNELAEYCTDNQELFRKIARNAGLEDPDYYLKMVLEKHEDWFIQPELALKMKLIDHLYAPTLVKKVSIEYELECPAGKDLTKGQLEERIRELERMVVEPQAKTKVIAPSIKAPLVDPKVKVDPGEVKVKTRKPRKKSSSPLEAAPAAAPVENRAPVPAPVEDAVPANNSVPPESPSAAKPQNRKQKQNIKPVEASTPVPVKENIAKPKNLSGLAVTTKAPTPMPKGLSVVYF